MEELRVQKGADVMIGRPANPIAPENVAAIAAAVATVPGVTEAHLPQCYVPGVSTAPAQVLVLVLSPGISDDAVMSQLQPKLRAIIPRGIALDVWPLDPRNELLSSVRATDCQIFSAPSNADSRRKWWQFWR
jgi:hypothetical protein